MPRISILVSLWLAIARDTGRDGDLAAAVTALLCFARELDARLQHAGAPSLGEALDLQRRLVHVLGSADAERIAAMRRVVAGLEDALEERAALLERLRFLKAAVG